MVRCRQRESTDLRFIVLSNNFFVVSRGFMTSSPIAVLYAAICQRRSVQRLVERRPNHRSVNYTDGIASSAWALRSPSRSFSATSRGSPVGMRPTSYMPNVRIKASVSTGSTRSPSTPRNDRARCAEKQVHFGLQLVADVARSADERAFGLARFQHGGIAELVAGQGWAVEHGPVDLGQHRSFAESAAGRSPGCRRPRPALPRSASRAAPGSPAGSRSRLLPSGSRS